MVGHTLVTPKHSATQYVYKFWSYEEVSLLNHGAGESWHLTNIKDPIVLIKAKLD